MYWGYDEDWYENPHDQLPDKYGRNINPWTMDWNELWNQGYQDFHDSVPLVDHPTNCSTQEVSIWRDGWAVAFQETLT